jgi:hypothetical protein
MTVTQKVTMLEESKKAVMRIHVNAQKARVFMCGPMKCGTRRSIRGRVPRRPS